MTPHLLSIALVNWNNRDFLKKCLKSIESANLNLNYEVVVVDHGSKDGSIEMLSREFPHVKLIRNATNVGIARGNNQCIQNSDGKYIYILNNDTIVNSSSIYSMLEFLENHPESAAAGGNLLNPDGSLQSSFCFFPTLKEEFLIVSHLGKRMNSIHPNYPGTWPEIREVDWLSSASIIVRRKAIEEIGLLDEDYFVYSDETDWQYRLWKAGWKVHYLPDENTIHFGGGSFTPGSKRFTLVYRGRMLFARKHYGRLYGFLQRLMFAIAAIMREIAWVVLYLLPSHRDRARMQIRNNIDTLKLCIRLQ